MAQGSYVEPSFERDTRYISDRITRDGEDGWPVEPGRYRLVAARACPWASRAIMVRRLLGLEDAISLGLCGPTHDSDSWTFDLDPGGLDPVLHIPRLKDAYEKRFPGYPRGITVPAMVDVPSGEVVTNDFVPMTQDFITQWTPYHRAGAPDLVAGEEAEQIRAEPTAERDSGQIVSGTGVHEPAVFGEAEHIAGKQERGDVSLSARELAVGLDDAFRDHEDPFRGRVFAIENGPARHVQRRGKS